MQIIDLSIMKWGWLIISAFLIGFSKTAINGFLTLVIAILASVFGAKESTGILLPMLVIGDVFAVYYYNQHAEWSKMKKILPWVFIGIVLGVIVGNHINDKRFKIFIAICVILCLIILIYMEKKKDSLKVPNSIWVYTLAGIATGFTTMIGNTGGPIFNIYLLAMGFKKDGFIGTTAWFFLIVNVSKVPLQVFFWNNVTLETFLMNLIVLPVILLGAVLGVKVIKKINEKVFHNIILVMTAIAAIRLIM